MNWLHIAGFLSAHEQKAAASLLEPHFQFTAALQLADSIHLHIRVDDTESLPMDELEKHGGAFDRGQPGYRKYLFPDGLNVIFSSIEVGEDASASRRPRPHLDHIGIDLRRENNIVQSGFDRIPSKAKSLHWGHVAQGGKNQPVSCCFIEVAAKHWVYPPDAEGARAIPLEFSFGPLKSTGTVAGDDLRPAAPIVQLASAAKQKCC